MSRNKMEIPVEYNGSNIGNVTEFNKDTGQMTVSLDMSKDGAKLLKEMIIQEAPISMSCKNEPCNPTECTCDAKPEHMGDGRYGKWHRQDCPMFDGDHPEICRESTLTDESQSGSQSGGIKCVECQKGPCKGDMIGVPCGYRKVTTEGN